MSLPVGLRAQVRLPSVLGSQWAAPLPLELHLVPYSAAEQRFDYGLGRRLTHPH